MNKLCILRLCVFVSLDNDLNGPKISMDNLTLVRKLQENFLIKPIKESKGRRIRYNLSDMSLKDPSMGQATEIAKILDYKVISSYRLNSAFNVTTLY